MKAQHRQPSKPLLTPAMIYVLWNNMIPQPPMPYWLKSFQDKPNPVPGTNFSVEQINQRESGSRSSSVWTQLIGSSARQRRYLYRGLARLGLVL